MASSHNKSYLLEHVSEVRENPRLNTQHEHITHGIMKGRLVHDSIPIVDLDGPVADICCGTGVWLKDLSDQIAGSRADDKSAAEFFGFDSNPSAFYDGDELPANVHLVKHDCTRPFNPEYHGKFGLVNMRGLTFAIPHETFPALLRNAVSLLKPGGYLQWLDTEPQLWKAIPESIDFNRALELVLQERRERGLVL